MPRLWQDTAPPLTLAGRQVGGGAAPFIVAEMSANHNGRLADALAIIDMAKRAGADAVKIQSYSADTITLDVDRPEFRIEGGLWHGKTLHQLYSEAATPESWHPALFEHAQKVGIPLFSAPFDESAVDMLEALGNPFYKIASCELVDLPLIARVAATGKPVILSTGMASESEINEALSCARQHGAKALMLLQCVSGYPAPAEDYNLKLIPAMRAQFGVPVGLSDHTLDALTATASVALGAALIEKHVTLDRSRGGPDDSFSLEETDLAALVRAARTAWQALGDGDYRVAASEAGTLTFRRSLYAVADIPAGSPLTPENIRSIRPGHGLAPKHYWSLLGRRARTHIKRGTPLAFDLLDPEP